MSSTLTLSAISPRERTVVTIRRAVSQDREGIAAVHVAAIRGLAHSHYSPAQIAAWSAGKTPERYPIDEHLMFVAVENGRVVGFSELRVEAHEVRAVYVAPEVARTGVGSRLLAAVEQAATEHGLTTLRLGASLNALPFYRGHGYRELGARATTADGAPYQPMEKRLTT